MTHGYGPLPGIGPRDPEPTEPACHTCGKPLVRQPDADRETQCSVCDHLVFTGDARARREFPRTLYRSTSAIWKCSDIDCNAPHCDRCAQGEVPA